MSFIWHNGTIRPGAAPMFTAQDRIRLGDGVFDTMLSVDGRLVNTDLHFQRLMHAADILHFRRCDLDARLNFTLWQDAAHTVLERSGLATGLAAVNTLISRGIGERGLRLPATMEPEIILAVSRVVPFHAPLLVITAQTVRRNEGSPLSRIKSFNYGDCILARHEAEEHGAEDAILLNNREQAACATASNIFIHTGGGWITPPLTDGAMDGIIRRKILQQGAAQEASISRRALSDAQSAVLTNSIGGVRSVDFLDGRALDTSRLPVDKDFHLF